MRKNFKLTAFDFECEDLTPRVATNGCDREALNDADAQIIGAGGKPGTIADDHKLDLTKRSDTLGGLLEPMIPRLGTMTYKEVVDELEELLCKVGKFPEQNKTVKKWRLYLRATRKPTHMDLINRITNAYLTAASLDVNGVGIGGRKKS